MPDIVKEYFEALERLIQGKPKRVHQGTKISNDTVSLEAGRKKGTIKKARPIFSELIKAIDAARKQDVKTSDDMQARLDEAKSEAKLYRVRWEEALAREVSLVKQLWDEQEMWAKEREALSGGKLTSINNAERKRNRE